MNYLEILDTAIKIGLGALITGLIAYFNQKVNLSASQTKENLLFKRNLLTSASNDIEEITHLVLKIWAIFELETRKYPMDKKRILERLDPFRASLFNDFNLLSKNEGLFLLYGYFDQQEKLRVYGELLGKFNSYTLFRDGDVNTDSTAEYKAKILKARKDLYLSLNKVLI